MKISTRKLRIQNNIYYFVRIVWYNFNLCICHAKKMLSPITLLDLQIKDNTVLSNGQRHA